MANVLNEEKKQQVLALGRLGWSLRQIQQATRIRRETASQYLKAAGIAVRPPGGWGRRAAKPANEVITDFGAGKPAIAAAPNCNGNPKTNPENLSTKGKAKPTSKPANEVITDPEVITDLNPSQPDEVSALSSTPVASPQHSPSASACDPYREAIALGLSRGRNAVAIYQNLVEEYGFTSSYQSVQRFVRKLRGTQTPEARVVIVTAPGQEAQVGQLLREHVRQKRGWYRIKPEDHSKRTPLRVSQLLWRAGRAGTHIGALCEALHRQQGEVGVRRILGVLSLAKKYGAAVTDEACAAALEMGVQEYRFVRRYLERCPQAPLTLQQVDPLIRELVQYRDLINCRTKEQENESH